MESKQALDEIYNILKEELTFEEDVNNLLNPIKEELQRYKTIEQELGIDLITLFKVMKANKIYFKKYHSYYENDGVDIETKSIYGFGEHKPNSVSALLKDYGKTWAINKTELSHS